jgi:two-component system response regulator PilR (NtrC family)
MAKLLIVDDEAGLRQLLAIVFEREGHEVGVAENGKRALAALRANPVDLMLSDVRMPDLTGIELLREARQFMPHLAVVMMTAYATVEDAREAFKLGADDFITKPFDIEELKLIIARTLQKLQLVKENESLKYEVQTLIKNQRERGQLGNIIGRSPNMQVIYQMIETVAEVPSTVLITGESGTGKELVARAIHNQSPRADKPFISINCGAFTETLLESELFGYVKGAFTGATSDRKGLFAAAHKGTIFLDEIGEMPLSMQVKLLRVLQERKVRPVGAHDESAIDTRVIAATNRDLAAMSRDNSFREDLYYRISVIPIELPPLRDRRDDIAVLVNHFVTKYCQQTGRHLSISDGALRLLENYDWPGNVRELENTVERAVALERSDAIQAERLPERILQYNPQQTASMLNLPDNGINLTAHLDHLEKTYLLEALNRTGGHQTRAADLLQLSVRSLRHLLDKHGIRSLSAQLRDNGEARL